MIKSNKDDTLYQTTKSKEQEVKCHASQKKVAVNCGYGDYNESLPNPKGLFVPTPPGPHLVNIMGLSERREREMFVCVAT